MMNDDSLYTQAELDSTIRRIVELELDPVHGEFDIPHLKEIHRRIFQDLPRNKIHPGQFRSPPPPGKEWVKNRSLNIGQGQVFRVVYSRMDIDANNRLKQILEIMAPGKLAGLNEAVFMEKIATLYAELDYLHPFSDGNSRTLRTFTRQLAAEAGYELNWGKLELVKDGRDLLYIARDMATNKLALPHIRDDENLFWVKHMLLCVEQCPSLAELLCKHKLLSRL